ncbi:hypothetical protein E4U43_002046 [Claviceps pusilla]|uniref:Uncharacterized protein n=1 Tax=Claviceps pusilla TaxID=123648 RepID=A0A9P7N7E1_9HYPO|nr:hypothetical protein E4U43_002046 [Claviceps pusilla]
MGDGQREGRRRRNEEAQDDGEGGKNCENCENGENGKDLAAIRMAMRSAGLHRALLQQERLRLLLPPGLPWLGASFAISFYLSHAMPTRSIDGVQCAQEPGGSFGLWTRESESEWSNSKRGGWDGSMTPCRAMIDGIHKLVVPGPSTRPVDRTRRQDSSTRPVNKTHQQDPYDLKSRQSRIKMTRRPHQLTPDDQATSPPPTRVQGINSELLTEFMRHHATEH